MVNKLCQIDFKVEETYRHRFQQKELAFKEKMWDVLCKNFFQRYVPTDSVVVDVASGYCEFINAIDARKKIAVDLNPDTKCFAKTDVDVILSPSTNLSDIESNSVDVAFTSNFFEHLKKEEIIQTVREIYRILKVNGSFLILQPNYRYCAKDYFMFFDHITPLDDRSLCEILELLNFKIIECKPKFLPFSTKSKLPKSIYLIKLYLRFNYCQKIFGKQCFISSKKQ